MTPIKGAAHILDFQHSVQKGVSYKALWKHVGARVSSSAVWFLYSWHFCLIGMDVRVMFYGFTVMNHHWYFCVFQKAGPRKKCVACKIVAHTDCLPLLEQVRLGFFLDQVMPVCLSVCLCLSVGEDVCPLWDTSCAVCLHVCHCLVCVSVGSWVRRISKTFD